MLKVVLDWDGTLTRQVPYICDRLGIPIPNRYITEEATNLTEYQKALLTQAYRSPMAWRDVPLEPEICRALTLSCVPYVYSGNTTVEMRDFKLACIRRINPNLPTDHIIMPISTTKPPIMDADIVIEDGLHFLLQYPSTAVRVLIDYPYNQDSAPGIIRVASLAQALDLTDSLINNS